MIKRPTGGWHPIARFWRWCHLMWRGHIDMARHNKWHCGEDFTAGLNHGKSRTYLDAIGCSCGKVFYSDIVIPGGSGKQTVGDLFNYLRNSM